VADDREPVIEVLLELEARRPLEDQQRAGYGIVRRLGLPDAGKDASVEVRRVEVLAEPKVTASRRRVLGKKEGYRPGALMAWDFSTEPEFPGQA